MKNTNRFILCFFLAFTAYILTPVPSNAQRCFPFERENTCGPCKRCVARYSYYPFYYKERDEKRAYRGRRAYDWFYRGWRCQPIPGCHQTPPPPKPQICPLSVIYSGAVQPGGSELKNTQGIDSFQLKIDAANCHTSSDVNACCASSQCPDLCVLLVSTYPSNIDCPSSTNSNAQCSKLQQAMNTYMQVDPQATITDIAAALADISPAALINDLNGSFDMAVFCQGYCSSSVPITATTPPQAMEAVSSAVSFEAMGSSEDFQAVAPHAPSYFPPPIKHDRFGRLKWRAPQRN